MERYQNHAFGWRKIRRMEKEKNKTVSPRVAFPFCLKTAKSKVALRKNRTALFLFWNYSIVFTIFPMIFLKHFLSHFYHLLNSGCKWMPTSCNTPWFNNCYFCWKNTLNYYNSVTWNSRIIFVCNKTFVINKNCWRITQVEIAVERVYADPQEGNDKWLRPPSENLRCRRHHPQKSGMHS